MKAPKTLRNVAVDRELMVDMYRKMLFFRRFEERANLAYTQQKFSGFCHLHIGQEALNVGVQTCLQPDDYVISGYRSHTQAIAKGIPAQKVFAELLGKSEGCSSGKGGSMHMFSKEHRFFGGHGIVGGQAPLAVGMAFKVNYEQENSIVVCYLGDAAMNQGQVFEAMNIAATWKVPVLFIIENNLYGMGTAIHRTTSIDHLYKRALAFDMKHSMIDAMNVLTVYEHMKSTVAFVRKNKEPFLVEAMTYRYKGHSVSDAGTYRTKEEVEEYQKRDPILQLQEDLARLDFADDDAFKAWDKEIREQVKEAEAFAEASPPPDERELWTNVFADET
ncbi:MAG: pyruvate dehydrogenase (acetyl-transferring) E1 component subunit alpha [Deltaproteobacteria bacterium]|nr:pyruvate dehydrogenase (acetyl-transferring) E1 component subunit alpha [Deltaproteobacteria bacterium]